MLSENIPKVWDIALKWCGCKTKWIEYVYKAHIQPYNTNCLLTKKQNKHKKTVAVREIIKKGARFSDSIKWDSFMVNPTDASREEQEMWTKVNTWVTWFSKNNIYIEDIIKSYMSEHRYTDEEIADKLNQRYKLNNQKLSKFLVNTYVNHSSTSSN